MIVIHHSTDHFGRRRLLRQGRRGPFVARHNLTYRAIFHATPMEASFPRGSLHLPGYVAYYRGSSPIAGGGRDTPGSPKPPGLCKRQWRCDEYGEQPGVREDGACVMINPNLLSAFETGRIMAAILYKLSGAYFLPPQSLPGVFGPATGVEKKPGTGQGVQLQHHSRTEPGR